MVVLEETEGGALLRLTPDEIWMINNALNEVCNGVEILDSEYQTRLGFQRSEMNALLDQTHSIITRRTARGWRE